MPHCMDEKFKLGHYRRHGDSACFHRVARFANTKPDGDDAATREKS